MERTLVNILQSGEVGAKHESLVVSHLVCRMCRGKRLIQLRSHLIQLHSEGSKLNRFDILLLKFIFGNNYIDS